jgi:predicted nuclease with TOPRIM domain
VVAPSKEDSELQEKLVELEVENAKLHEEVKDQRALIQKLEQRMLVLFAKIAQMEQEAVVTQHGDEVGDVAE